MLMARRRLQGVAAARQRGLSLVELMIGVALGLFIVAGAQMLWVGQVGDNRRLAVDTRVQQSLRAAMMTITRQLRRTGGLGLYDGSNWVAAYGPYVSPGPFQDVTLSGGSPASEIAFSFYWTASDQGKFGYKLQDGALWARDDGVLVLGWGASGIWQPVTDPTTMVVRELSFTPQLTESAKLPCPTLCADGTTNCWPTIWLRNYVVKIVARAKNGLADGDPEVERTLTSQVRVRNDLMGMNDAAHPTQACPLP
jgi:type II secretory pathway pseudopilin PulG